jgi:hypothetical protein
VNLAVQLCTNPHGKIAPFGQAPILCPSAVTSSPIDTTHLPGITTLVEPNNLLLTSSAASASLATTAATTTTQVLPNSDQNSLHSHSKFDPTPTNEYTSPISNLSSVITPPPEPFDDHSTTPHPAFASSHHSSSPTQKNCLEDVVVAQIGFLAVENDDDTSIDAQIAPESSQETLDYYNNIQDYLHHLNMEGTEKKKTSNSGSDPSSSSTGIPPLPVVSPIDTAVETTTAMDEEALITPKKKTGRPHSSSRQTYFNLCLISFYSSPLYSISILSTLMSDFLF